MPAGAPPRNASETRALQRTPVATWVGVGGWKSKVIDCSVRSDVKCGSGIKPCWCWRCGNWTWTVLFLLWSYAGSSPVFPTAPHRACTPETDKVVLTIFRARQTEWKLLRCAFFKTSVSIHGGAGQVMVQRSVPHAGYKGSQGRGDKALHQTP